MWKVRGVRIVAASRRKLRVAGSQISAEALMPMVETVLAEAALHRGRQFLAGGIAATVEESQDQVRQLAAAVGEPERGEALARRIGHAAARLERAQAATPVPTILWQPGGIVPGEATLVADLMRRAGLASHTAADMVVKTSTV